MIAKLIIVPLSVVTCTIPVAGIGVGDVIGVEATVGVGVGLDVEMGD